MWKFPELAVIPSTDKRFNGSRIFDWKLLIDSGYVIILCATLSFVSALGRKPAPVTGISMTNLSLQARTYAESANYLII